MQPSKLFSALFLMFIFSTYQLEGLVHSHELYPNVIQTILCTTTFPGDRHGAFSGDLVSHLSDGSAWKIHPESRATYDTWSPGDAVRMKVRTEWYWFKREHKFSLYNYNRNTSVKVMIVHHKEHPVPLKIEHTNYYYAGTETVPIDQEITIYHPDGTQNKIVSTHWETRPSDYRKILMLSDGSVWDIRDTFNKFVVGRNVFVGAQEREYYIFDFILLTGDQREAAWTWACPHE